jgi:hypothetical protein
MHDESAPDFTGKVVAVSLATSQMALALDQVRYERQLGKLYLVGRQVANPQYPNWADGATYYIAPEQITFFAVFESLADYLARVAARPPEPSPPGEPPRRGWLGRRG